MQRTWATIYAIFCTLLMVVGFIAAFYFSWLSGAGDSIACLIGMVIGFMLSSTVHELGHVLFASLSGMECVYVKCFCFAFEREMDGKMKISFVSPFADDRTQVLPKHSQNMQNRACAYTLGGLAFGLLFLLIVSAVALITTFLGVPSYLFWGMLPYAAYLFLLNAVPLEYASGKTDMLVFLGIKKGYDAEKNMLSAMEIHGFLYEGKSFAEIDEEKYYDLPQLCEDEPLYAVILDLRYRYHLEKEEYDKAADCLNRLAQSQAYLPDEELEKVAAELTYMHALNADLESAEESGKLCRDFLQKEQVTSKRVLATFSAAFGKTDAAETLKVQAIELLETERIAGVRKFEEKLLSRI